ncbi:MAG: serine hydrolase [Bacteroidetes bacterium]|nr:MAG: serine hydrolase [Bacteroidota bacterium]TAE69631.1 MAG: serine hydrolase [Bacteroidota bacterium]TAF94156.1 MAG: serine hydrolase [Bacteroidota bacterium]
MKKWLFLAILIWQTNGLNAQAFLQESEPAKAWVDSIFNTLTQEQKIAQLMVVRAHSNLGIAHTNELRQLITKYKIGGLCFFQGGPIRQALLTNEFQQLSTIPLMIAIDGEWGLGMRLDSVINFPRQLMMGALPNTRLVYDFGKAVGLQCKRIGIHVNYAPDIDINNNPNNPVINDRSFGEDKYKVANFGIAYMRGMQDVGVMACAKHFPGHGDVAVDSHYDLPIIQKSLASLDSLELYPFKQLFNAGVGSVMVAHLSIPAIDSTPNKPTSISRNNVTDLMRNTLGYKGLSFTDALDMKGVAKFYAAGEASAESLIAGNDMLCLPGDIPGSIQKVMNAITTGRLSQAELDSKVKRALLAKYNLGLNKVSPIDTTNLATDLNLYTKDLRKQLAEQAITLVRTNKTIAFPVQKDKRLAYVGIGIDSANSFAKGMESLGAKMFYISSNDSATIDKKLRKIKNKYTIVVGWHKYSRRPQNNFSLSETVVKSLQKLSEKSKVQFVVFGNPYALKNIANAENILLAYEDDEYTHNAAFKVLTNTLTPVGTLPVTVTPELPFGTKVLPTETSKTTSALQNAISPIVEKAIAEKATPGAVVLVAHKGNIVYQQGFGNTMYQGGTAVTRETVYDLASVTKTSATTMAIMKLYDEGKITLNQNLASLLPELANTNKANITVKDILTHQAGLVAWIPFYRETIDTITGNPNPALYSKTASANFSVPVAENLYMKNSWLDTMYKRIQTSKVASEVKYVYSDNDFILLGKIVEKLTGKPLDVYVHETFYQPLQMHSTNFTPLQYLPINTIAPTEKEKAFRQQLIHGYVHDPGAAMLGGVAGHAGLFSNAKDLAQLYLMLLNKGERNNQRFLNAATIELFTAYQSSISRRGLGFDKPEKDNATRKEAYPAKYVSSNTFGHTGFTGTCVWADADNELLYIFLSNRVHPQGADNNLLGKLNIRSQIHDAIYSVLVNKP